MVDSSRSAENSETPHAIPIKPTSIVVVRSVSLIALTFDIAVSCIKLVLIIILSGFSVEAPERIKIDLVQHDTNYLIGYGFRRMNSKFNRFDGCRTPFDHQNISVHER